LRRRTTGGHSSRASVSEQSSTYQFYEQPNERIVHTGLGERSIIVEEPTIQEEDEFVNSLPVPEVVRIEPPVIPGVNAFIPNEDIIRTAVPTGKTERFIVWEEESGEYCEHPGFTKTNRYRVIEVKEQFKATNGIKFWKTTQEKEYSTVLSNHNLASYDVIQPGAVDCFKSFFA
jgi:hypothetical protein